MVTREQGRGSQARVVARCAAGQLCSVALPTTSGQIRHHSAVRLLAPPRLLATHLQDQGLALRVHRLLEGRRDGEEAGVRARLDAGVSLRVAEPLAGSQRPVARGAVLHLPAALHPPLLPGGTWAGG